MRDQKAPKGVFFYEKREKKIMSLVQQGYQWGTIGALGTTTVTANPSNLIGVVITGTYVGTVKFHDAGSSTGTTASSNIVTFGLPATSVAGNIHINARCKNGITYEATGTPIMTFLWDGL